MKIDSGTRHVETSGVQSQGQFSIKTSAQAFQLLSSGLYSNKIKAVIRELACNAADAHKMVKNKAPIEIKIPNALDNQFYVKDFGPGLDHSQVMKLYTTYFESTKSESNDMTGGFGLGSKSPFAYTDSFTVESVQNGVKNIYTAYVDDNNIPNIAHLGETPTDEPSGLTVGFPVKPADFRRFESEALEVLSWFDTPATLRGSAETVRSRIAKNEIAYQTDNTIMFGNPFNVKKQESYRGNLNSNHRSHDATVVMGNVAYPLKHQDEWSENKKISWLFKHQTVFTWPIGKVSVAVSREDLAYDKPSLKALPGILEESFNSVAQKIKEQIDYIFKHNSGLSRDMQLQALMEYTGFNEPGMFKVFSETVSLTPELEKALKPKTVYPFKPTTFDIIAINDYGESLTNPKYWQPAPATPLRINKMPGFFENVAGRYGKDIQTRWSMFKSQNRLEHSDYYMILPKSKMAFTPAYEEELKKWKDELGVDLLDFLPRTQRADNELMVPAALMERYSYYRKNADQVLTVETPTFLWVSTEDVEKRRSLSHYLEGFKKTLGLEKLPPIFQIDKEYLDDAKKLPNGVNLWDHLEKVLADPKVIKKIEKIKPMIEGSSYMFSGLRNRLRNKKDWQDILTNTKLGGWLKDMDKTKGSGSYDFATVCWLQSIKVFKPNLVIPVPAYYKGDDIENQLRDKYPLLLNKLLVKETYISNDVLEKISTSLAQYVKWAEENGIAAPPHESTISANDDSSPNP